MEQFLGGSLTVFMREVEEVAIGLNLPPAKRTLAACLKVLGDRFVGVTSDELALAFFVVQIRCVTDHLKSNISKPSQPSRPSD